MIYIVFLRNTNCDDLLCYVVPWGTYENSLAIDFFIRVLGCRMNCKHGDHTWSAGHNTCVLKWAAMYVLLLDFIEAKSKCTYVM